MEKILALIGMVVITGGAYLISKHKKEINWISVGCAFLGQIILAFLMIKTPLWKAVEFLSNGVTWIISQANEGIEFVFGGLLGTGYVFILNSLMPIVFISAFMGILFHFGIIQWFVGSVAGIVAKVLHVDKLVATNGITNMFLGQTDILFVTKAYLPNAKDSAIFAMMVGGMTSISVSVVGLYASYGASMEWILVSMPLTVFSTFVLTQILMPTQYSDEELVIETTDKGCNFIETAMNYGQAGFKTVVGISVGLMVFLSMLALINSILGKCVDGLTLQSILGYVFKPFAYLMGVPSSDVTAVSEILATKFATNEAVAFALPQFNQLGANAKAMMTVALCGFAGISSVGIQIAGFGAIAPNKTKVVAKYGFYALLTATFVNILTGAVICLML